MSASSMFFPFSILFLFFIPPCLSQTNNQYERCSPIPFNCGKFSFNVTYPFSIDGSPSGCSYPGVHLTCTSESYVQLSIMSGTSYQVMNIDYEKQILTIADYLTYLHEKCPLPSSDAPAFQPSLFNYTGNDHIVSFFNCPGQIVGDHPDFYQLPCDQTNHYYTMLFDYTFNESYSYGYGFQLGNFTCFPEYQVPVHASYVNDLTNATEYKRVVTLKEALLEGFDLEWIPGMGWCNGCVRSGGRCGYDPFKPNDPLCLCPNNSYPTSCPLISTKKTPSKITLGTKKRTNKIIGISVATTTIVILVVAFLVIFRWRDSMIYNIFSKEMGKDNINVEKFMKDYHSMLPTKFSYLEIKRLTNDFRDKLGQGGYGSVYKGKLANGHLIAAKMLEKSKDNGQDFINEVATIGRIHHFNIIRLLGFCCEGSRRALIYEYMPNGSLGDLISNEDDARHNLGREKLLEIAIGIANGIQYMHNGCDTRILHLDIKPQNVLLDHDYHPKISDFGLAKLYSRKDSVVSLTGARGTIGYIAPEVFMRTVGGVTHKSDVYSYGMLLLDMIVGRKNVEFENDLSSMLYFPNGIYTQLERWNDMEKLESSIVDEGLCIARKMVLVGLWCIQINPFDRPPINRVLEMLEGSDAGIEIPPKPFFPSSTVESFELQSSSASTLKDATSRTSESL